MLTILSSSSTTMSILSDSTASRNLDVWNTNKPESCKENLSPNIPNMVDDGDIDAEIQEAGRDIRRLSARLEILLTKKAERARGWVEPARFLEPKKPLQTPEVKKKMKNLEGSSLKKVEPSPVSARFQRRGLSLGPMEIQSGVRTAEQERMGTKFSDRSRGVTAVGANRPIQDAQDPSRILKPKLLFQEVRDSVPNKTPPKGMKGRVIASRYSLAPERISDVGSSRRKWSIPKAGKLEIACSADVKTPLSHGESDANGRHVKAPLWIVLPMIRTPRRTMDSPRDSGCVKRVADLIGKKSYFDHRALKFDEESE